MIRRIAMVGGLFRFGLLATLLTLAANAGAAGLPSCRDAWRELYPQQSYQFQSGYRTQESYAEYRARVPRERCLKDWTILIYMEARQDLAPYALWDLDEMEATFESSSPTAASTLTTDLLAEIRIEGAPGIRRIHLFEDNRPRSATQLEDYKRRTISDIRSPVVDQRFDNDRSLAEFILWGMRHYPARRTAVVIWGHGRGWKPVRSPLEIWTLSRSFDSAEIARSLARAARAAGRPIDLFAADSCLMQSADALSAYAGNARYVVGTDQIQDLMGFPYRRVLYELNHGDLEKTSNPPEALARIIPPLMLQSMNPRTGSQGRYSRDGATTLLMSAVDADRFQRKSLPAIDALFLEVAKALRASTPAQRERLRSLIRSTFPLGEETQDFAVILGLLSRWSKDHAPQLERSIQNAEQELLASIVSFARGPGYNTDPNTAISWQLPVGISAWLPQGREELENNLERYLNSPFVSRPSNPWRQWLEALYFE